MEQPQISWVSKLILFLIQFFVSIAIFLFFKNFIFSGAWIFDSHALMNILSGSIAILCAYLMLFKYQKMIQQFSIANINLGEKLGERTAEIVKANEEMRQEINRRQILEEALKESEERFSTIFREAAIGIALLDNKGRFLECNPTLQQILGYNLTELRAMELSKINYGERNQDGKGYFEEILAGSNGVWHAEKRFIHKNGDLGWCSQSISVVRDAAGTPRFLIAMIEDITKRREVENKIMSYQTQLQRLATELSLTEERERRSLATYLHDHIGQALALAKIKMVDLLESPVSENISFLLGEAKRLVEQSIRYTKSLVFELSPPILYDLGFEETVEWLAEQIKQEHGLFVKVNNDGKQKPLDIETGVVVFRAVRELLLNVVKHAKASIAIVTMSRADNQLQILVEDNGKGFLPENDRHKTANGYGIFSIRERIQYLEGTFKIESKLNQGTRVTLAIPLKAAKSQRPVSQKANRAARKTPAAVHKTPASKRASVIN